MRAQLKQTIRQRVLVSYLRKQGWEEVKDEGASEKFLVLRTWVDVRHGQEPLDIVLCRSRNQRNYRDFDIYLNNAINLLAAMSDNKPEHEWYLIMWPYYRMWKKIAIWSAVAMLYILTIVLSFRAGKSSCS